MWTKLHTSPKVHGLIHGTSPGGCEGGASDKTKRFGPIRLKKLLSAASVDEEWAEQRHSRSTGPETKLTSGEVLTC